MKAYSVSLFIMLTIASASALSETHFLDSANCGTAGHEPCFGGFTDTSNLHKLNNTLHDTDVSPTTQTNSLPYNQISISQFGLLINTLKGIGTILFYSTFGVYWFFDKIWLPDSIKFILSLGIYITYIVGILQYWSRTSLQGTE